MRACSESQPVAGDGFLRTGYMQPIAIDLNAYGANGVFVDVTGPAGYVERRLHTCARRERQRGR